MFTTEIAPKLSAGFVYEVTPGKFNVNFGVSAQPTYTWTTTTLTNANINTVTVTETKDKVGNVTTSKEVTVNNNGDAETKTTALSTSCPTEINLGATWFFTENVSFDAYILSSFDLNYIYYWDDSSHSHSHSHSYSKNLFDTSRAGASVTVKF